MRRILLIVAMLLIATPALATVTVNAVYKDPGHTGTGIVEVNYTTTGEAVRAFALDISVSGGLTIDEINDYNVGDNNNYGIFPGKFRERIDAASPNWVDPCYNPVAPELDPGAQGPLGTSAITIEMGSLYVAGFAPPGEGKLFKLKCNFNGAVAGNLTLAVNSNRGGVVLEDGSTVEPVLNPTEVRGIYIPAAPVITYAAVDYNGYYPVSWSAPVGATSYELDVCSTGGNFGSIYTGASNIFAEGPKAIGIYRYRVNATNDAGTSGFATGNDINVKAPLTPKLLYPKWDPDQNVPVLWDSAECNAFNLEYSTDGGGGGTWSSLYNGANRGFGHLKIANGLYRYRVRASNNFGTTDWNAPNYDCNVYLSTCYRDGNTKDGNWATWVQVGRPDCWCKATTAQEPNGSGYQCDGDADGAAYGGNPSTAFRIYAGDLAMLSTHWKKAASNLTSDPNVTLSGKMKIQAACADADHKGYGGNPATSFRIYAADLTIIGTTNWKKLNSSTVTATNRLPGNCPR